MARAISKKLKDGSVRWYALYWDANGKERSDGGFARRRDAERHAHRREQQTAEGRFDDPRNGKMTFRRYIESYYWPSAKHLELTTRAAYQSNLDRHFLPRFGDMAMRRITASTIQAWVNDAHDSGLSSRSVRKYHAVLHRIFSRAVVDRVVSYNPCADTELPKFVAQPKRIVTSDEFDLVLSKIDSRYQTLVLLDIETGLRWGELIALRPCDVDFATNTIVVRRVIVEVSKKISPSGERLLVKDYPKDDEWRRVQIDQGTGQLIRQHMMALGIRDDDLLFATRAGTPISRNTFRTRVWVPAVEAAKLAQKLTFHNLRAAHASWLLAGGADIQTVRERLGHRLITTTQQYLGTLPDAGDRALAAFRRIRYRGPERDKI